MFEFLIEYYDENNDKNDMSKGFVSASDMAEAIQQLSNYYGEENILEIKLKYVNDHSFLFVPKGIDIEEIKDFN